MTARNAATLASLALGLGVLCGAAACTNFYEIPIETPIQPKMDVSPFTRVLVAGFIGGGTEDVDANLETVRLLRSQLRSKSTLRVIEADALSLSALANEQTAKEPAGQNGKDRSQSPGGAADGQQLPPVAQMPASTTPEPEPAAAPKGGRNNTNDEAKIRNEKDLEKYQGIFAIEGDTLKWCSCNERSRTRPTALRTSTKDGHFLMVLTRKK